MTVALTRLASPGPVSGWVGRAIGVFTYVFIRENSDGCAARVNEVPMSSNFAQGDYLSKGTKLSPGLKEMKNFLFSAPHYRTWKSSRGKHISASAHASAKGVFLAIRQ